VYFFFKVNNIIVMKVTVYNFYNSLNTLIVVYNYFEGQSYNSHRRLRYIIFTKGHIVIVTKRTSIVYRDVVGFLSPDYVSS